MLVKVQQREIRIEASILENDEKYRSIIRRDDLNDNVKGKEKIIMMDRMSKSRKIQVCYSYRKKRRQNQVRIRSYKNRVEVIKLVISYYLVKLALILAG